MNMTVLMVNFAIAPEVETEFNRFYHRVFLPRIMANAPEIQSIRRFEEFGIGGSLRWYNKQFLTIYILRGDNVAQSTDVIFERPEVTEVVKEFRQWKNDSMSNFSRVTFKQSWVHQRLSSGEPLAARPFFLWQTEMHPDKDEEFQTWYQNDYLPLQIAEIPAWSAITRFSSVGLEQVRRLTFFEAPDEQALVRCLNDLRAPQRIDQNNEWHKRVQPAIAWQDASTFRPIYRWPD